MNAQRKPNDKQKEQKERTFAAFKISSQEVTNGTWYVDSCASTHITIVNNKLQHSQAYKGAGIVAVNHQAMTAEAVGEVKLHVQTRNGTEEIVAKNVLYVPDSAGNLLSVSKLVQKGLSVNFTPKGHTIVNAKGRCLRVMIEENEIFRLEMSTEKTYIAAKELSAKIWHRRLGHLNSKSLEALSNGLVNGIRFQRIENMQCVPCIKGKHHRQPFPKEGNRATETL